MENARPGRLIIGKATTESQLRKLKTDIFRHRSAKGGQASTRKRTGYLRRLFEFCLRVVISLGTPRSTRPAGLRGSSSSSKLPTGILDATDACFFDGILSHNGQLPNREFFSSGLGI